VCDKVKDVPNRALDKRKDVLRHDDSPIKKD
jgi:hypothetical protein